MQNVILALVVGVLGGAGSAYFTVKAMQPDGPGNAGPAADASVADGDYAARIAAMEKWQAANNTPQLMGTGPEPANGALANLSIEALKAKLFEAGLLDGVREILPEAIDTRLEERGLPKGEDISTDGGLAAMMGEPKKKVTLAELAQEMNLTGHEEDELRRMSEEIGTKFVGFLAEEGESVEDIKAELLAAKDDPDKQALVGMKYLGRILPKMGEVMGTMMEFQARGVKLLGKERFDKFETYEVTDLDPLGLGSLFGD